MPLKVVSGNHQTSFYFVIASLITLATLVAASYEGYATIAPDVLYFLAILLFALLVGAAYYLTR